MKCYYVLHYLRWIDFMLLLLLLFYCRDYCNPFYFGLFKIFFFSLIFLYFVFVHTLSFPFKIFLMYLFYFLFYSNTIIEFKVLLIYLNATLVVDIYIFLILHFQGFKYMKGTKRTWLDEIESALGRVLFKCCRCVRRIKSGCANPGVYDHRWSVARQQQPSPPVRMRRVVRIPQSTDPKVAPRPSQHLDAASSLSFTVGQHQNRLWNDFKKQVGGRMRNKKPSTTFLSFFFVLFVLMLANMFALFPIIKASEHQQDVFFNSNCSKKC